MAAVAEPTGGIRMTTINGVKVYSVSGHKSILPSLNPRSKKAAGGNQKVELVQDLEFTTATTRIKVTPDGQFLVASGVYPPQVKVYELKELSMKFERHLTSEIVNFEILSEDYSKLAFLCADRSVCLHAKFGSYFSTRIPRMGRDFVYDKWSCDLLVAASSPEVYRLNLEQGRFLAPLVTRSPGLNVISRSSVHGLIGCGGDDGALECFDPRQKASIGRLDAVAPTGHADQAVTALSFDEVEGTHVAVGTSNGQVLLYDLRSSKPLLTKDHMYGSPISDIKWHESVNTTSRLLVTTDSRVVRIWDSKTGKGITSIEPPTGDINHVCLLPETGLLFMALDSPQVASFFMPALGPAPKWCSFLENLTEELDETGRTNIYEDFKFVTNEWLESHNATNLIGTPDLHAYMHGYFMKYRQYEKVKAMADPFAYELNRQKLIQARLESERAARITAKRKLPKVNRPLASRIMATEFAEEGGAEEELYKNEGSQKKRKVGSELLEDERFAQMFQDEDFEVDMEAPEYKILHPNAPRNKMSLEDEHLKLLDESDTDESEEANGSSLSSSEDEAKEPTLRRKSEKKDRQPRFYEAKDEVHAQAFRNKQSLVKLHDVPLGERLGGVGETSTGHTDKPYAGRYGGSREVSFVPRNGHSAGESEIGSRKKRGIQSLGLNENTRGGGRGGGRGSSRGRGGRGRGRGRGSR